ncbi:nSTAND1 domain-containing NTPase [Thiorhodovibrio frisius]|uniref:WD40 repeat-containing protein n=1 Tax=Thiorhodovibrio frisius TaxID=631362 RepID=H8YZB2_9GAMM|nr:AAA family ATPase [Thiorhodovibrio frisius]EIC22039.1 WD40 repeat-containing protein [Thiorhodovibrio frisius]WPL24330.1 putative protein containing caspase domain protein [Thiorhodovibrio frisius]
MKDDQVRIFVSSPTDVDHERAIVKDVVERLAQEYLPYFPLRAILWEEEALTADRTFQAGLTQPSECEIVLVILWTRLGSPLPDDPYHGMTGTEWEFIDAVTNSDDEGLPEVLVFKKATSKLVDITDAEKAQEAITDRRRLEDFFRSHFFNEDNTFRRAFRTFDGDAQFRELIEGQLRKLLNRRVSAERRAAAGEHQWRGSPFRACQAFEPGDERVFTGRETELRELTERLQARAEAGAGVVLLSGPSGSGKTSLLRAGMVSRLTRPFRVERIAAVRCCLVSPPSLPQDPLVALAESLCAESCLGDALGGFGLDAPALATLLAQDPAVGARQLSAALQHSARVQILEGQVRLAIIVDPLDVLFDAPEEADSEDPVAQEAGEQKLRLFAQALAELARSGEIWVLVGMRSDALRHLPRLPALAAMLDASAWQRLEPLPGARIRQIVEIPARIAGIEFEDQANGPGRGLIELIEAEAGRLRQWAPPLQALLHAAYLNARDGAPADDNALRLSLEHWCTQGGLAGQVLSQADALWRDNLDEAARAALPRLCRALLVLDNNGQPQARMGDLTVLEQDLQTRRLLTAMVAARLLTSEAECDPSLTAICEHPNYSLLKSVHALWRLGRDARARDKGARVAPSADPLAVAPVASVPGASDRSGFATDAPMQQSAGDSVQADAGAVAETIDFSHYKGVVSVAHPVLLSRWQPIRDWLSDPDNRALLRLREQLSRQARLWKRTSCNREYLFGEAGFAAVRRFAEAFPDELEPLECEFLQQTAAYLAFVRRRNRLVRAFGLLLVLLVVTASTAAWIAQRKSEDARLAMHGVQLKEADLQSRGGNTPQAVSRALAAGVDLPAASVRTLSDAFSRNRLIAMTAAPSPSLSQPSQPAANAAGDLLATLEPGQGARRWRLSDGSFVPADPAVLSDGSLGVHSLVMALETDEVFGIAEDGVYRLPAFAGDVPDYPCGAVAGSSLALDSARQRLALAVPGEGAHQRVCVLDLTESGKVLLNYGLEEQELRGLSFSPDGSALLTASSIGRTHLIDLDTPAGEDPVRLSLPLDGPTGRPFNRAIFDLAGERIGIAAADEQVRLFDLEGNLIVALKSVDIDGRQVQIHNSAVRDLAFAPDGRSLVAVDDEGQVVRWSLSDPPQAVVLGHHELSIVSVEVALTLPPKDASDRQVAEVRPTLVLTASLDGTARLWSLATGKPLAVFGHDAALSWARFAASAGRVLSHSVRDGSLRLWNVVPVSRLAFGLRHPDPANHVWHLDMAAVPAELLGEDDPADSAAAAPVWLATGGYDGRVQVWRYERDAKPPQLSYSFPQHGTAAGAVAPEDIRPVRRVRFSPSGKRLAAARFDGSASLYDLLTGRSCQLEVAERSSTSTDERGAGKVFQVLFAPDERWLLATSDDPLRPLRLFDPRSCEPIAGIALLEQPGVATEAAAVRALGTNTLVAVGDDAGRVLVLRVDQAGTWHQVCARAADVGAISDLAIAPDGGALAIAGESNDLAILGLGEGDCGQLEHVSGHSARLYSVAYSPDGERLLTSSLDKTARLWTRTGQPLAVLNGHQDRVYHAAFSPNDGRWLLTAARDGSLRVWQAPSADRTLGEVQQLSDFLPLQANSGGAAFAAFSPGGRYVAGAYWDNAAILWRLWREDTLADAKLVSDWGPDRARLALLKEAYRFKNDNQVSAADAKAATATGDDD